MVESVVWEIHNNLEVSMRVGKISNLFSVSNAHTIFVSYPLPRPCARAGQLS
jgi:hypothetical protein